MEASLPQKLAYQELALIALLSLLISASVEADNREIQAEFYNRFRVKFLDRCHHIAINLYRNSPDWEMIRDDVFQETFITALEDIKKFKMDEKWDDAECEKVVLFWLSKIANNKLLKRKKKEKKEQTILNGDYKYFLKVEGKSGVVVKRNYEPTYNKAKFDAVWEKLNPMSREIILLCAANETLCEDNKKHLPDDKITYLKEKYKVTPATIRKAKQRTIDTLKTCKF